MVIAHCELRINPKVFMKHFLKLSFVLWLCSLLPSAASADEFTCTADINPEKYEKLLANISNASENTKNLKADFVQKSYFLGLDKIEAGTGKVAFQKTAKMRWDYQTPAKQLFVMDGENVWFYQPAQNQAIVTDVYNSFKSDVPVSFLLGLGKLSETFSAESACTTTGGTLMTLSLKKSDDSLDKFYLLVRTSDYAPIGVKIVDLGGNETSILFKNLRLNGSIDSNEFAFTPPKGVDIMDNRTPGPVIIRGVVGEEDM